MSAFSLDEKNAIVTGAGKGIGRAIAESLAAAGAQVALFDLDEAAAAEAVENIEAKGGSAKFVSCDVSDLASVEAAIEETGFPSIDILVNNAGVAHVGTATTTTSDDFDRVMNVNVKGVYHCLHAVLPRMVESGGGVVLNLSSVAAIAGLPDRFAYSASKGAVHTMTLSVAADYIDHGIRCNCICPARVHTPFVDGYLEKNYPDNRDEMFAKLSAAQPIGRMATPAEIGQLALYLCSDAASFVTGAAWPIDGGYMNVRN